MYSGAIRNNAATRTYPFSFTQNVADAWEYKTVTVSGCTDGVWDKTNLVGLTLYITMAADSTRTAAAGVWSSASPNPLGVTGTTNGLSLATDTFQITGVVILPGIEAPLAARSALIMRPFDQEIITCQRYYEKTYPYADAPGKVYGSVSAGGALGDMVYAATSYTTVPWLFQTRKRATPIITVYSPNTGASGKFRQIQSR